MLILAPHAAVQGSGLSPAGVCLATTLWLQATLALIAPAILLRTWSTGGCSSTGGSGESSPSSPTGSGSSASEGSAPRALVWQQQPRTALRVLGEWVDEQPVQMGIFLSMTTWLALHATMAHLLPA